MSGRFAPMLVVLVGCATHQGAQPDARPGSAAGRELVPSAQLRAVADRFYCAATRTEASARVDDARRLSRDSAITHEIASQLAQLDDREGDRVDELLAAISDTSNPDAVLHLHLLRQGQLTF